MTATPQLYSRVDNDLSFHAAKPGGATAAAHDAIRRSAKMWADVLLAWVPEGRELSTALTKVEESMFWANAGIARNSDGE